LKDRDGRFCRLLDGFGKIRGFADYGLAVTKLPESANWAWEIKIDGYRAIAVKSDDRVNLYSRTRNSFNGKFNYMVDALSDMPARVFG